MALHIIFGFLILFLFYRMFLKGKIKYYLYGIINLKASNYESAIDNLNKAIIKNPNSFKSYYFLGEAYRFLSEKKNEQENINTLESVDHYFKAVFFSKIADNYNFLHSSLSSLKLIYYSLDTESKFKNLNNIFRFTHDLDKAALKSLFKNELSDLLSEYLEINTFDSNLFFKELKEPIIRYYEITSIKKFDFEELNSVSFKNFLDEIGVTDLKFILVKETKYVRHWEPNERFGITITKSLFKKISLDSTLVIDVKKTIEESNSGYFTNFILLQKKRQLYKWNT